MKLEEKETRLENLKKEVESLEKEISQEKEWRPGEKYYVWDEAKRPKLPIINYATKDYGWFKRSSVVHGDFQYENWEPIENKRLRLYCYRDENRFCRIVPKKIEGMKKDEYGSWSGVSLFSSIALSNDEEFDRMFPGWLPAPGEHGEI